MRTMEGNLNRISTGSSEIWYPVGFPAIPDSLIFSLFKTCLFAYLSLERSMAGVLWKYFPIFFMTVPSRPPASLRSRGLQGKLGHFQRSDTEGLWGLAELEKGESELRDVASAVRARAPQRAGRGIKSHRLSASCPTSASVLFPCGWCSAPPNLPLW